MSFPRARRHTRKFFELSYLNSESGEYQAGWNDAWMVCFWIVVFTGLRASVMDYILTPLAKRGGVKSQRDLKRFAEQAWLLLYYSVFWPLGMVRQAILSLLVSFLKLTSISMLIPTTGSTPRKCGQTGLIEKSRACRSGIFLRNTLSGCSKSWSSISSRDGRTTGRCSPTTS